MLYRGQSRNTCSISTVCECDRDCLFVLSWARMRHFTFVSVASDVLYLSVIVHICRLRLHYITMWMKIIVWKLTLLLWKELNIKIINSELLKEIQNDNVCVYLLWSFLKSHEGNLDMYCNIFTRSYFKPCFAVGLLNKQSKHFVNTINAPNSLER